MLAEVLKAVGKFADTDTLASCTDTINANLSVFLAMGVADDLFEVVLERVRSASQEQGMVARPFLAAVTNLVHRLPGRDDIAKQLQQELIQSDRTNAIDACSPVSDSNLASTAQSSDGEVSDEIDKLLANGNSIDHPTMNRFFRNIVPKLEAGWAKSDDSRRVFASLLNRLRVFDVKHFDKLMADWNLPHPVTEASARALEYDSTAGEPRLPVNPDTPQHGERFAPHDGCRRQ